MIASLQLDASSYGAENRAAIVDLRAVVKDIHSRLALFDLTSKTFTRRQFEEVIRHLSATFED